MEDRNIHDHISSLVQEERDLRAQLADGQISGADEQSRLKQVEVELDRCWDLLRQRDAKREFGQNADDAAPRSAGQVEGYQQ